VWLAGVPSSNVFSRSIHSLSLPARGVLKRF
jgi:hypothetical protein